MYLFKRTVSVISSDPLCKDGKALFAAVSSKALSDQEYELGIHV